MKARFVIKIILLFIVLAAAAVGAAAIRSHIINSKPDLNQLISLCEESVAKGDYDKAVKLCDEGIMIFPEAQKLHELKAEACYLLGDSEKAAAAIDYGYKQTNSSELLELKDRYAVTADDDESYLDVDINTQQTGVSEEIFTESTTAGNVYTRKTQETYAVTIPPEVELPDVTAATAITVPEAESPEQQPSETKP